ncbi:NfeD family protein [Microbulbifer thermotolerans]|uniref:Serine protease n=1 Tax=Microbulbifer thermotolerans TaxID=252514 RepID=A0A143HNP5_MICTH|nr:nodulation protein NfeD [Microbulbifer thermotolerans]AMX03117.1 serine protease [Microbulbifer thermotolerans]MCX2831503.1 nodulation protein NfeD [Microbulbifer thermotolerans]MCX2835849.1 nodulation protein NfeD [Microbulbifer thermotolerans]SFD11965.1 membrane-bound serine protease (ClpP class) [Microbulbifer thermotolerans]
MSKWISKLSLSVAVLLLVAFIAAGAGGQQQVRPHIALLSIEGPIGPATTDYLVRATEEAAEAGAQLIVIQMDTPGGLDAASRDIIQHILASPVPVATYVHPAGARAASAGTYILYASQIAAMTPATTLGAATPVQMGGMPGQPAPGEQPGDQSAGKEDKEREEGAASNGKKAVPDSGTAMQRKIVNDSVAFIRGLAKRHGRNADWAEKAVRDAATLTASEALEENVIDIVANNTQDLIKQSAGREVILDEGSLTLSSDLADLPLESYRPDWRNELLALITNPQIAYILLLIGIYGLIFEGYNPGALVPGIIGIICLLLAFYALQVLPINYAGLALIVVGVALIVAEVFVPSFGALGIGGIIALVIGSVMLIDTDVPGMQVSRGLIGAIAGVSGLAMLGILLAVGKSLRKPRPAMDQALVGSAAVVSNIEDGDVLVHLNGEIWRASCAQPLRQGQRVRVVAQKGLLLQVEPEESG